LTRPCAVIVLATNPGDRMRSLVPKPLHQIGYVPMLHHTIASTQVLAPEKMVVVAGRGADFLARAAWEVDQSIDIVVAMLWHGTAHAVFQAHTSLNGFEGDLVILSADTPFIGKETFSAIQSCRDDLDVVALGFEASDPSENGRMIVSPGGRLEAIVEATDATPEQLDLTLCSSGVIAGDCRAIFDLLNETTAENARAEYYLGDVVRLASVKGLRCGVVMCDEFEATAINDRVQLAEAEQTFQTRARKHAMLSGATLIDPSTVFFSIDTKIGMDVTVEPNVIFRPGTVVENGMYIESGTILPSRKKTRMQNDQPKTNAQDVFLCHGVEDKKEVREVYNFLKDNGISSWLDEINIPLGADWNIEIRKAIKNVKIVLVLLSRKSVAKTGYLQKEIRFALDRADEMPDGSVFIIPVRLDDCELPERLSKWQRLDWDDAGSGSRLVNDLRTLLE